MTYVATHGLNGGPLEDEKDWQSLAEDMGRDWEEVRDAYRSWKMEIDVVLPTKADEAYEPEEGACVQYNLESYEVIFNLLFCFSNLVMIFLRISRSCGLAFLFICCISA